MAENTSYYDWSLRNTKRKDLTQDEVLIVGKNYINLAKVKEIVGTAKNLLENPESLMKTPKSLVKICSNLNSLLQCSLKVNGLNGINSDLILEEMEKAIESNLKQLILKI